MKKPIDYFRSLEKKKLEWQMKLDKAKLNFVVDKIVGNRQNFIRNYSVFSHDKYSSVNNSNIISNPKLSITNKNDIRSNIIYKLEKDNPVQYRKKVFDRDSFAAIYQKKSSVPSLKHVHNSNRNRKGRIIKGCNEKNIFNDENSLIDHDYYNNCNYNNNNNNDVLPLIEDNNKQAQKYFNLSISKTNLNI